MRIYIESNNLFYKKGLEFLIPNLLKEQETERISFISPCACDEKIEPTNIIFRDSSISINLFKENTEPCESEKIQHKSTIHIPFVCKKRNLADISWMIRKILLIANVSSDAFSNGDFYQLTGLKKHDQLSLTETKIMLLIGRGHNFSIISRKLHRSKKTISVHCRNASRKMGLENKVDFYNYAKFISTCRRNERRTLCL